MFSMTFDELARVVGGRPLAGSPDHVFTGVVTDSRKVTPGCLFVPLKGEHVDGHQYIAQAIARGAVGALTERTDVEGQGGCLVLVSNALAALHDMARHHLAVTGVKVIGITGSVGKTTTKDMIAAVLGQRYRVLKSEGNLNTEVGLPLTIFNLEDNHEIAVLEMGMRGPGEIAELCRIAKPDVAVLTNISEVHLELLGSIENIALAKAEILEALGESGIAVLNADDPWVMKMRSKARGTVITYGIANSADTMAYEIETLGLGGSRFTVDLDGERMGRVHLPVPGEHNILNALAAVSVGRALGMSFEQVNAGLASFTPSAQRLNIINLSDGSILINDSYNAGPKSVAATLGVLREIRGDRPTIAVLGDMLELGEAAERAHLTVGALVHSTGVDRLITRGQLARRIAKGALEAGMAPERIRAAISNRDALSALLDWLQPGSAILIKGSRGMAMEEIVEGLLDHLRQ
ncbi:MAG: UDP-N-acetylmuramoyl-tripeptide--D-alanyl-D-alanine ligase [Bacillota bacterium]